MIDLEGGRAFSALSDSLAAEREPGGWSAIHPPFDRLRLALTDSHPRATGRDLAVLLRQALLFEYNRRNRATRPEVVIKHPRFSGVKWLEHSLDARPVSDGMSVRPGNWAPEWLAGAEVGVDMYAAAEEPRRFDEGSAIPGDPFLAVIGRECYRSLGQRAAARATLAAPPGSSLAVALATGEGKSLLFHLIQAVGFTNDTTPSMGTTLVVVPTVALGVDQEAAAAYLPNHELPLAYRSRDEPNNAVLKDRIVGGTQGLCFASPEAACGPLRWALAKAAEQGTLRAIVIDEAHLVDRWGTGFRTEFQELSGLRAELLEKSPPQYAPRTLLLSATLTASSLRTLSDLFGQPGEFRVLRAAQLRPEPDYWIAPVSDEEVREQRVLEALNHAPRPAILYVTEVKHATAWSTRLREEHFGRVRTLHGGTTPTEREEILRMWRQGQLDLVVGTSAFGLGIDYPHVRSVIHACVPETLDRFYQEVGRGGRDGRASLSLMLPSPADFRVAAGLSEEKVIGVPRGLIRWKSMFARKKQLGSATFAVPLDVPPTVSEDDIDMRGERNKDWNVRTLTLLARAGIIRLTGRPTREQVGDGEWLIVEILDDGHAWEETWQERVAPLRSQIARANARNLGLMTEFTERVTCAAEIFLDLYGRDSMVARCSRCAECRIDPRNQRPQGHDREHIATWPAKPPGEVSRALIGDSGRLLITYSQRTLRQGWSRRIGELIHRMAREGFSNVIQLGAPVLGMHEFERLEKLPLFTSNVTSLPMSGLPKGPEIIFLGRDARLSSVNFAARAPGLERIFFVPDDLPDPVRPDRLFVDVFNGRRFAFEEFYPRMTS